MSEVGDDEEPVVERDQLKHRPERPSDSIETIHVVMYVSEQPDTEHSEHVCVTTKRLFLFTRLLPRRRRTRN